MGELIEFPTRGDDRDPDDIDDSMSANPEPVREDARGDLGYEVTAEPRTRRPPRGDKAGRWVVEFRDGDAAGVPDPAAPKICRACNEPANILHSVGTSIERTVCGKCQGKANRQRIGWGGGERP